jgi:hypothetical protein
LNLTPSLSITPAQNNHFQGFTERPHENPIKRKSPDHSTNPVDLDDVNIKMPPSKRSAISPSRMQQPQHPMLNMVPLNSQINTQHSSSVAANLPTNSNNIAQNGFVFNAGQIKLEDMTLWRELREKERLFTSCKMFCLS